jgi:hypothetical protein
MGDDQLFPDLRAGRVAGHGGLGEAHARAHKQRLDGRNRHGEDVGELGVAHAAQLAQEQRRALLIGQATDIRDQPSQRLAALGLGNRVGHRRGDEVNHLGGDRHRTAKLIDAAVVRDPVQPGPKGEIAIVGPQRRVGAHEHVLESVFGILSRSREHLARIREQPLPITVVDDPERVLVALAEEDDELLVGPKPQQRYRGGQMLPAETCRCLES